MAPGKGGISKMVGTRNPKNRGPDGVDEAKLINTTTNKKKDGGPGAGESSRTSSSAPPPKALADVMSSVASSAEASKTDKQKSNAFLQEEEPESRAEVRIEVSATQDVEEPIAARTRKRARQLNAEDEPTSKRPRPNAIDLSSQNASRHNTDAADATSEADPEHDNEGRVVGVKRAPKRSTAKKPTAAENGASSFTRTLRSTASGPGQARQATSGPHEAVPATQGQHDPNDEEDDEEEGGNVGELDHNLGATTNQSSGPARRSVAENDGTAPVNAVAEEDAASANELVDQSDEDIGDAEVTDDDNDDEEEVFPQDQVAGGVLYKLSDLHKIKKHAKTVGKKTSKAHKNKILKRTSTEQGTKVWEKVCKLSKIYSDAASNNGDGSVESLPLAGPALLDVREAVEEMCLSVLSEVKRTNASIKLLLEVFFLIIPKLQDTVWSAVSVYSLRKDTPDSSLDEISVLVRVLLKLSSRSIKHRHAPLGVDVKRTIQRYIYDQPTAANIPHLKVLLSKIQGELTSRRELEEGAARQAWIQQQKREQEQLEAESKEQRRKDEAARKDRIQREIAEKEERRREQLARNFDDPILGALLRQQAMEVLEKQRGGKASRDKPRRSFAYSQSMPAEQEEDDEWFENEFEDSHVEYDGRYGDLNDGDEVGEEVEEVDAGLDDNNVERLSIFDHESRPKTPAPPPWTKKEDELFVNCMKYYSQRDDRFVRTAATLKKSVDEVIEYAKDFQRAMTDSHDNGQFLDEEYRWTALVWDFEAEANV